MSVFCKGCRKTKVNEDFGLKDNGTQYKTCVKCRSRKIKKIEEEETIIECCDVELIRNTFRQLNCEVVYANDMKFMMDLESGLARAFFNNMIKTKNFVIVETITWDSYSFIMNLFSHLGFDMSDVEAININLIIYKDSKDTMMRCINGSDRNIFDGFISCMKLPNKKMCDICNNKKKCFRTCFKCKNKMCFECFKNHNKDYVNSCPYCRYNITEHGTMKNMFEERNLADLFPNGLQMY